MSDYTVDMIKYVVDQKPNEFVNSFNAQMQQKVTDIITGYKDELARGYLSPEEEPEEEEQQETEVTSDEDSETNT